MSNKYDAVFEGGGVKGIAFAGALKRMEEEGVAFDRFAGTSAGAITSGLCAAGYGADELKDILWKTDFTQFADPKKIFKGKWYEIFYRFLGLFWSCLGYGLFSTDNFYKWMKDLLADKGVSDFASSKSYIRVFASDIAQQKLLKFDKDNNSNMLVAQAVRMSMSFPLFFRGTVDKSKESLVVDGGLLDNYPIDTFNDHGGLATTIGFKLISNSEREAKDIPKNILAFLLSMIETMQSCLERTHIDNAKWAKTVPIPTGDVSTLNFNLSEEEKQFLWQSGYDSADKAIKEGILNAKGRLDS